MVMIEKASFVDTSAMKFSAVVFFTCFQVWIVILSPELFTNLFQFIET